MTEMRHQFLPTSEERFVLHFEFFALSIFLVLMPFFSKKSFHVGAKPDDQL